MNVWCCSCFEDSFWYLQILKERDQEEKKRGREGRRKEGRRSMKGEKGGGRVELQNTNSEGQSYTNIFT